LQVLRVQVAGGHQPAQSQQASKHPLQGRLPLARRRLERGMRLLGALQPP
jgi:hypothetical protein